MSKVIGLGGAGKPPQPQAMNINLSEQPTLRCSGCDGLFFTPSFIVKKISKIITGQSTDQLAPIQLLRCADCGEVLKESVPDPSIFDNE
jgi:phage FluMu protein Com